MLGERNLRGGQSLLGHVAERAWWCNEEHNSVGSDDVGEVGRHDGESVWELWSRLTLIISVIISVNFHSLAWTQSNSFILNFH